MNIWPDRKLYDQNNVEYCHLMLRKGYQAKMTIKLSICIPTYNRAACLKECLDSILVSTRPFSLQVEIIISDNASTDDTRSVVSEFLKTDPWIQYHRNDKNIGAERNFYSVAAMAAGEYIWVFGDDDKITNEAVSVIIDRLGFGYDLLISNYSMWSKDFSVLRKQRGLSGDRDEEVKDPNELMKRFSLHLGYISSIIIKKDLFFKLPYSEYEAYLEYGFPFAYAVYTGMMPKCHTVFISAPLFYNRAENSGNFDWYKYFVTGTSLIFNALIKKGYTQSAVRHAKHIILKDFVIYDILRRKRDGDTTFGLFNLMLPYYKKNWFFWCGIVPLLAVPGFLVRAARTIVKSIRRAK